MDTVLKVVGGTVLVLGGIAFFAILMGFPTKWCVNYLFTPQVLTSLFGVAKLTVWHGVVLNCLGGLIFKGSSSSSSK